MTSQRKLARVTTAFLIATVPVFSALAKTQTGDSGVEKELRLQLGDESGNEVKALKTELLVIKSEKKALEQLLKLQKKYAGTRMEPEILFRLAELYMRRARSERFFEVHKGDQQILSFAPQLIKEASEATEVHKAIVFYTQIQEKFPHFHSIDVVLFNTAYAYQQVGEDKSAEQLFVKLIKDHASSALVPDAFLSIGEINFKARNYKVALENFNAIHKFPKARVYPYGLYKAAWCYYNLQDAASGMKSLEEVIEFGRQVASNSWDSKLDLRKEALSDLSLFYGDVRPANLAVDYFRQQAQEIDASLYIMHLEDLYKRHGRFADVEVVLKDLLLKMPNSEAVPSAHEELVWNFDHTKHQSAAVDQLVAFDQYCAQAVEAAAKAKLNAKTDSKKNFKKTQVVERLECQNKISEVSKKLATKWHGVWKKFGDPSTNSELSASAERAYRLFLKSAEAKDVDLPAVRYAFAELMFARKNYREASENYAALDEYQKSGLHVEAKIAHDAHYAAIVSLEKAVGDKWNDVDEKRFNQLADSYLNHHPDGQYVLELHFKRAFIAYEKERYDEAAILFKKIGWAKAPVNASASDNEKIVKSQDLYLDILNIKKDYKAIKEASQELLNRFSGAGRATQIEKIYREAYFAEIQQKEEKGDLTGAIESYKKFALENTASELAPKAWWNASQLQFRMGDATGGANTCYQMHKLFPNSSNGKDCLTKAATTFEAMGRLDLAARVVLNLATVETENQDKWREVAADFFALSGAKDRAVTMYLKIAESKQGAVLFALLGKAAQAARDINDQKTIAAIEAQYTSKGIEPQASRLVVEQAENAFQSGDMTRAFNTAKRVIAKDSLPKDILARARFVQARVLEDEYRKQSVKAKMERVGIVLAIKTEKLEKAQKAYQSAIRYADPSTSVQALARLGDCYLDYAQTVRNMTVTSSLAAADQEAFKGEIEQIAIPMEEKGIESVNQALETARKSQLRDGQIAELQMQVNKLNMKPTVGVAIKVAGPVVYLPRFPASIAATAPGVTTDKEVVR